jgi:formylmethanofuran dehydrogenase subunit E
MNRVHERKSRKIRAILDAPDETLLTVASVPVAEPDMARIYPSVTCADCGEKVMEPRTRLLGGSVVCIPCFEKKGDS